MVEMRTRDEVLREIEEDLRREEALWREIHRDLVGLQGEPPTMRPLDRFIATVIVVAAMTVAAFGLGWNLAPSNATTVGGVAPAVVWNDTTAFTADREAAGWMAVTP
jgi:hypothetical protein